MNTSAVQFRSRISRTAEVAVERARLTVVPRRRTRAARMPFVALVTVILLGGVVGLLLFNTSMQQASFAATALEGQANTLAARQQTLQMDLDRLRNPQRIAEAAQRLGMVQACSPAFLQLGTGKVTGQPCPGDGSTPFPIRKQPPQKPSELSPKNRVVWVPPADPAGGSASNSGDTTGQIGVSGSRTDKNQQTHQSHQTQR
jgi:Flp pilus assembly protein TadG